jgi:hypothetical protein
MLSNLVDRVRGRWARTLAAGTVVFATAWLAACGGGENAGTPPFGGGDSGGTVKAADLTLVLDAVTLNNTGTETVKATVTAVDANRNTVAGIPVTLSVDGSATVQVSGNATDTNGVVTGQVGIGANSSNRALTVRAVSGDLVRTATIQVVGSRLTGTPVPAVLAPGAAGKVQYKLVNANSIAMAGVDIVVTGADGIETRGTTGVNGEFDYSYTAPAAAGTATIRAAAAGVEDVQTVQVQAGPGAIPPATAGSVRSASVSANPSVVAVNTAGQSSNRAEVRALFVGDANAPIKNVRVRFDLDGDPQSIGGSFSSGTALVYSNDSGVATSAYIPGTRFSPTDKVTVRACWDYTDFAAGTCPNAARASLTVVSDALSVSIGTNNKIQVGTSGLTYVKRYLVQVNDSSGLFKSDVVVSPLLDLTHYRKGFYTYNGEQWVKTEVAQCPNEDLNRNGVNEVYSNGGIEDANASFNDPPGRAALDPAKSYVTVSFEGSNRTDSLGQVVLRLEYPQDVATWIDFNLVVAAAGVAGTEGRASLFGVLPALADDIFSKNGPAFVVSPFGIQPSPTVVVQTPDGLAAASLCTSKD